MLSNIGGVQLAIILVIIVLIFGTKKLRSLGEDLGAGIKGVKEGFGADSVEQVAEEVRDARKSLNSFSATVSEGDKNDSRYAY